MDNGDGTFKVKSYSERCRKTTIGSKVPGPVVQLPDDDDEDVVHKALHDCGFTHGTRAAKDSKNRDCLAVEEHLERCPSCQQRHANPLWYIYPLVDACHSMRNADMDCSERLVRYSQGEMLNKHLSNIALTPTADQAYVNLFLSELKEPVISNGATVYKFDGVTWVEWTDQRIKTDMQVWLSGLLEHLLRLVSVETIRGVADPRFQNANSVHKSLVKALHHVNSEGTVGNFVKAVKRAQGVYSESLDDELDGDAYLLGCASGVIDLKACVFRTARPEDRVTMSVGYPFLDTVDPEIEAAVEDFVTSIYPLEAERNLMQRWCGYCLLGHANAKHFLLLSDARDGFNGKSTMLRLLAATMGEYATKPDPAILYKEDRPRGANEHSAAVVALRKKRMAFVEETDPSRMLAEEVIKDWTGGGTRISGRACGSPQVVEFDFVTKLVVAFNQGKCFHFSTEDSALLQRMLTIPHRSRFYTGGIPDEPYSYKADPDLREKFDQWRPYFLKWCLEGLKDYHCQAFRDIPLSCRSFKEDLVAEKDVVAEFLKQALQPAGAKEYVQVKELYRSFDAAYRTLQKDKRTKKTPTTFKKAVKDIMSAAYRDSYGFRDSAGKCRTVTSAVWGYSQSPV